MNRKGRKTAWKWTLTNIGAVISMMGLMLAIFVFFNFLLTGWILMILFIPAFIVVLIGYSLIVKDYFDKRKVAARRASKGERGLEEE